MRRVILAIDAGSSGIRCTGYEYVGVQTPHSQADLDIDRSIPPFNVFEMEGISRTIPMASVVPNTGYIRIDLVLAAIDDCIGDVLRLLRRKREDEKPEESYQIVAIGFSTFVANLVAVDIDGNPVGESATLSYACNREDVVKECQFLKDKLGPEKVQAMYQRTGAPLHPAYALPQLLAFYHNKNNREMATRIHKWTSISSICVHRWSGKLDIQVPLSYSEASWTGMLNYRECNWDKEVVEIFEACDGIAQFSIDGDYGDSIDLLPPLVDYDAALPFMMKGIPSYNSDGSENTYWHMWPELRSSNLRLFLGVGDGVAANVGSKCGGNPESGTLRIAVTIGTSAACRIVLPFSLHEPPMSPRDILVPPGLFCYRVNRDHILVGGALTDGGSVVEWARTILGLESDESFDACLEKVSEIYGSHTSPDSSSSASSGVTMVPFLSGERSTGFRGGAQGCISGLTRKTKPEHIMYACLESVISRIGCVMKLLHESLSIKCSEVVASGTALQRNPLWRQMLADCTSMDVVIDGESSSEDTSRGVAMMIAGSLRQRELGSPLASINFFEEPLEIKYKAKTNAAAEGHWRDVMLRQESLIDAVSSTWNETT